jgi:predicted ATPase
LSIEAERGLFQIRLEQPGMLRALTAAELSDGTLRYLLLMAALLAPLRPQLLVLNEPETSLHPDLLPALARLIAHAGERCQVVVVTHARELVAALRTAAGSAVLELEKSLGQTRLAGYNMVDLPGWSWPAR